MWRDVTLETLAAGGAGERFNRALRAVLENIQDLNTSAKKPRTVTLVVKIQPLNEEREHLGVSYEVRGKTVDMSPVPMSGYVGRRGEQIVLRMVDPSQRDLLEEDQEEADGVTPINRKAEGE